MIVTTTVDGPAAVDSCAYAWLAPDTATMATSAAIQRVMTDLLRSFLALGLCNCELRCVRFQSGRRSIARSVVRARSTGDVRTMAVCDFWTMAASYDLPDNFRRWVGCRRPPAKPRRSRRTRRIEDSPS